MSEIVAKKGIFSKKGLLIMLAIIVIIAIVAVVYMSYKNAEERKAIKQTYDTTTSTLLTQVKELLGMENPAISDTVKATIQAKIDANTSAYEMAKSIVEILKADNLTGDTNIKNTIHNEVVKVLELKYKPKQVAKAILTTAK